MLLNEHTIQEKGVEKGSVGFLLTPTKIEKELYFYITECGHYYCSRDYEINRNYYPQPLVMCILKGCMIAEYRKCRHRLTAGSVIVIDCSEPHRYYAAADGLEFLFLHFDGSNSHQLVKHILNTTGARPEGGSCAVIRQMLETRIEICRGYAAEPVVESSHWVYTLIKNLHRDNESYSYQSRSYVETVSRYINLHIGEKITVHELASLCGWSDSYFSHKLKEDTGYTPIEYVIEKKMTYARSLLFHTDLSVEEIADHIGYSLRGFINTFSERNNCAPGQLRKEIRLINQVNKKGRDL